MNTRSEQPNPEAAANPRNDVQNPPNRRPPSTVAEIVMVIFVGITALIYI
jgi:hypothetical protein